MLTMFEFLIRVVVSAGINKNFLKNLNFQRGPRGYLKSEGDEFDSQNSRQKIKIIQASAASSTTHLSVNVNWIRRRPVNLQFGFSIFCDLPYKRHRLAKVLVFVRHFHIEEADRFLRRCADRASLLELLSVGLEIFFVARRIKILKGISLSHHNHHKWKALNFDFQELKFVGKSGEKIFTFRSMTTGLVMSGSI